MKAITTALAAGLCAAAAVAFAQTSETPHFKYEGDHGPEHWGDLSSDWAKCKTGTRQSPAQIRAGPLKGQSDASQRFGNYGSMPFNVENNGHTLVVKPPTNTSYGFQFTRDTPIAYPIDRPDQRYPDDSYNLAEIHFHAPSEHTIDGNQFELEAHLVHTNASGGKAVVGVLFEEGTTANPFLVPILANLPPKTTPQGLTVDPRDLLPTRMDLYYYIGSLTTPPCSEPVSWYVFLPRGTATRAQLDGMRDAIGSVGNARPSPANRAKRGVMYNMKGNVWPPLPR